jgi:hypothetical protein
MKLSYWWALSSPVVRLTSAAAIVLDGGGAISWFLGKSSSLFTGGRLWEGRNGWKVLQKEKETWVVTGGRERSTFLGRENFGFFSCAVRDSLVFSWKVHHGFGGEKLEEVQEQVYWTDFCFPIWGSLMHALLQRPFYCGQFSNWCHYFFLMCVTAILGLKVLMHALAHRSFQRKKKYKDNDTSWFWTWHAIEFFFLF